MKNKKGFSLVEMLIVVAIIAILVGITIPVINNQLEKSRRAVDISNVRQLESVLTYAYLGGQIVFPNKDTAVWIYATDNSVIYRTNGSSKFPVVNGKQEKDANDELKKIVNDAGFADDSLYVHAKQSTNNGDASKVDGWKWYCVYLKGDGTCGVTSGAGDASSTFINTWGNFKSNAIFAGCENTSLSRILKGE